MNSDQEEADTKIALHVQHALETGRHPIIVRSPSGDTDIVVLLLALFPGKKIILDNGHGIHRKVMDLEKCELDIPWKKALLGYHAFTCNDYVSGFFRKGKKHCWEILKKYPMFIDTFMQLGSGWDIDDSLFAMLEEYACKVLEGKISQVSIRLGSKFSGINMAKTKPLLILLCYHPARKV